MNDEWVETTLGECCSFVSDKVDPATLDPETPYIGLEHFEPGVGRLSRSGSASEVTSLVSRYAEGDTLFGRLRPYLHKVAFVSSAGVCSPEVLVLRPRTHVVDPAYLHCLASSDPAIEHAVSLSAGSRMPRTSSADLGSFPVSLPPLPVQRRIVDLMAHLDNHLANLQTERDAAARLLVALRDEQLEPGDDWQVMRLLEVTTKVGSGATPRGGESSYVSSGISLIRSQNVYDYHFEWEGLARISDEQAQLLDGVTVRDQDVLINITGASVNRCCIVPSEALPARVNQHVAILRPDPEIVSSDFLLNSLRQSRVKAELDRMAGSGTTRQALTKSQLENLKISVPPVEDQASLVSPMQALHSVWEGCGREAERLTLFRASLLSSLLLGRSSIPDAYDALLSEVA